MIKDGDTYIYSLDSFADSIEILRQAVGTTKVVQAEGCYKGEREPSIISTGKVLTTALVLGLLDNQESILHVEKGHKNAYYAALEYLQGGKREPLGFLITVPEDVALKQEAWTRFEGIYWITAKRKSYLASEWGYHRAG